MSVEPNTARKKMRYRVMASRSQLYYFEIEAVSL